MIKQNMQDIAHLLWGRYDSALIVELNAPSSKIIDFAKTSHVCRVVVITPGLDYGHSAQVGGIVTDEGIKYGEVADGC